MKYKVVSNAVDLNRLCNMTNIKIKWRKDILSNVDATLYCCDTITQLTLPFLSWVSYGRTNKLELVLGEAFLPTTKIKLISDKRLYDLDGEIKVGHYNPTSLEYQILSFPLSFTDSEELEEE